MSAGEEKKEQEKNDLDYYALLNVRRSGSIEDIQRSYKELSRTFHPDKQQQQSATDTSFFVQFKEAFDILSDPIYRMAYDLYGHSGVGFLQQTAQQKSLYQELQQLHRREPQLARLKLEESFQHFHYQQFQKDCVTHEISTHSDWKSSFNDDDSADLELDQVQWNVQIQSKEGASNEGGTLTVGSAVRKNHTMMDGALEWNYQLSPEPNTDVSIGINGTGGGLQLQSTRVFTNRSIWTLGCSLFHKHLSLTSHRNLFQNCYRVTWSISSAITHFHYALISITALEPTNHKIRTTLKCNLGMDPNYPIKLIFQPQPSSSNETQPKSSSTWQYSISFGFLPQPYQLAAMWTTTFYSQTKLGVGIVHDSIKGLTSIWRFQQDNKFTLQIPIRFYSIMDPLYTPSAISYACKSIFIHQLLSSVSLLLSSFHPTQPPPLSLSPQKIQSSLHYNHCTHNNNIKANMTSVSRRKRQFEQDKLQASSCGLVIAHASLHRKNGCLDTKEQIIDVTAQLQFWVNSDTSSLHLQASHCQHYLLGINPSLLVSAMTNTSPEDWFFSLMNDYHCIIANGWNRFWFGSHYPSKQNSSNVKNHHDENYYMIRYKTNQGVYEIQIQQNEEIHLPHPNAMKLGNSQSVV